MQQSRYNYTNMTRDSGSALTCFEAANSSAANSNIKASMHVYHKTIHHSVPDIRFFMGLAPNKLDHWGFCWLQPCFPLGQVQPNGESQSQAAISCFADPNVLLSPRRGPTLETWTGRPICRPDCLDRQLRCVLTKRIGYMTERR